MYNTKKSKMKTQKLSVAGAQAQGMKLAGGLSGAVTQGAVSSVAKKYLPASMSQFVDPATVVIGVIISTLYSKNEFLEAAGFGMAFKPGWSIVQDQLQAIVPAGNGDGFVDTAVSGAIGMGNPMNTRTIPVGMLRNMKGQRNDVISISNSGTTSSDSNLSMAL